MQGFKGSSTGRFDQQIVQQLSSKEYPQTVIFDARPGINVAANQLLGKGQENVEDYQGVEKVIQLGI